MLSPCISLWGSKLGQILWLSSTGGLTCLIHATFTEKTTPLLGLFLREGLRDPLKAGLLH